MSGGGSSPTSSTTYSSNIPSYAQPYVMGQAATGTSPGISGTLPQASALTNLANNPYQAYQGQMVAGFNPLQQQGMNTIQGMTPASQLGQATGMAGSAGLQAGNAGSTYNPGQIGNSQVGTQNYTGQNVNQYMSPYTQDVVQAQQNQAIQGYANNYLPQLGAAAASTGNLPMGQSGGSSREAITQAVGNQGLQSQLQGITAGGYQNAFQNAQGQFNTQQQANLQAQQANQSAGLTAQGQSLQSQQYGAGLGLQGLQTQLSAANTLGTLGQTQYGQQAGIASAQVGAGQQGQNLEQQQLNTNYQNFVNQQNYPYAQLGFEEGMLTGTAGTTGGTGISSAYQQAPNTLGQVAGLGTAATGLAGLFGGTA